jgi:uncharacterized protein (TIGR03382 family)
MRSSSLAWLVAVLAPSIASAHIRITSPTPRSTTVLKDQHCGATGLARANIHTVPPGSILHLVWDEYIAHPGWFRISFQQNGDTFEIPLVSNGKTGSGATSNYPTEDLTGKTDPTTGSLIVADRIMHPALSYDVQLPNVECTNCTLQLIQMMTDKPPYTTDTASDDIYFACVDLVLSAAAPDAGADNGGGGGGNGGGGGGGAPDAGIGSGPGASGGCNATGGGPGLLVLALVVVFALVGLPRRRRRGTLQPSLASRAF